MWKDVPFTFGLYEAHSDGFVRSKDRITGEEGRTCYFRKGKLLSHIRSGFRGNYLSGVMTINGKKTRHYLHRVIASTFLGEIPEGVEVCHNNDDKHDNRAVNLRYDTHKSNCMDRARNGVCKVGSETKQAKLKESEVLEIRRLKSEGVVQNQIARQFGVHPMTVSMIVRGKIWKHLIGAVRIGGENCFNYTHKDA